MTSRRLLALSLLTLLSACQAAPIAPMNMNAASRMRIAAKNADWHSQLPPQLQSYYAEAKGLTGRPLFEALNKIVSRGHTPLDYGAARAFMYGTADNFSQRATSGVVDVYSDLFIPGKGGNGNDYRERADENRDGTSGDFINCEHTWPQSFFNKSLPMVSDMHHLFPTLSKPNGMRGHHPFGMASEGKVVYSTISGSRLSLRSSRQLSFSTVPEPGKDFTPFSNQDAVFEPGNNQKGNTARAMLYFYLRYHRQNIFGGDFENDNFWNKRVAMFHNWADKVDPVDERERTRHEMVAQKQGNRNPFIDIPDLTSLIGEDTMIKR